MARVFLSLGSNLGDRELMLTRTRQALEAKRIQIERASFVLDNKAVIVDDQPDFLNQIVIVQTDLEPEELLTVVKEMEISLGRKARARYGPREIDIDILSYGSRHFTTERLTIPHPGLLDRSYLRTLLADLGETPEGLTGS